MYLAFCSREKLVNIYISLYDYVYLYTHSFLPIAKLPKIHNMPLYIIYYYITLYCNIIIVTICITYVISYIVTDIYNKKKIKFTEYKSQPIVPVILGYK